MPGVSFMSSEEAMRRVGNNCGNLVFEYAVSNLIDEETRIVGQDIPWDPESVARQCRALVIPSANFLNEDFDFSIFVDFLERAEVPLVFIGLGAQADNYDNKVFNFHPSVLRLIQLIRERSELVSVRGAFTKKVLAAHGVHNAVITGCPSNFINPDPDLPEKIYEKSKTQPANILVHANEPWPKNGKNLEVERILYSIAQNPHSLMVQQSVPSMIRFLRHHNSYSEKDSTAHYINALLDSVAPEVPLDAFLTFLKTKVRTYFSVDQWLEDSAKFDFSIGMRLHGNMVAWQAGTPALWIYHDSRTRELVETMGLPSVSVDEFINDWSGLLRERVKYSFDVDLYKSRRALLREKLAAVLNAHEISMKV